MEQIDFEDIRVGDVIEARRTYTTNNEVATWRGTVRSLDGEYANTEQFTFSANSTAEYFLIERPKPTFKVGDTITGDQVKDLPPGSVFSWNGGRPRFVTQTSVVTPGGTVYDKNDYGSGCALTILFLPEA